MLALLALPSCCCLKQQDKKDCGVEEKSCCASVDETLPATPVSELPLFPANGLPDPCDCEMSVTQVLGLPESGFFKVETSENDGSTEWIVIHENSIDQNTEIEISPSVALYLAFHPPGRQYFQDYCVYRI